MRFCIDQYSCKYLLEIHIHNRYSAIECLVPNDSKDLYAAFRLKYESYIENNFLFEVSVEFQVCHAGVEIRADFAMPIQTN